MFHLSGFVKKIVSRVQCNVFVDVTQQHIDECLSLSGNDCAIFKAIEQGTKYDVESVSYVFATFGGTAYQFSGELFQWQHDITNGKDNVSPIRIVFNKRQETAKIVRE